MNMMRWIRVIQRIGPFGLLYLETNPARMSSFPPITSNSCWEKGEFQVFIPDPILDHSISSMEFFLVGNFLGLRPDIENMRSMVKRNRPFVVKLIL